MYSTFIKQKWGEMHGALGASQIPQTTWITGAHGSQNELERSIQIMQWFCCGTIEKMIIFKIYANLVGNVRFFLQYFGSPKITTAISKWPTTWGLMALTTQVLWMAWVGKNTWQWWKTQPCYAPLFCGNCLEKRISRRETFPDVPAWYVALWNALLVSWWPMESGFGGFLHLVPTQTVVLFCFFLLGGDKIWEMAHPTIHANHQPTSEKPQVFPRFSTWTLSRLRLRRCKKLGTTSATEKDEWPHESI